MNKNAELFGYQPVGLISYSTDDDSGGMEWRMQQTPGLLSVV